MMFEFSYFFFNFKTKSILILFICNLFYEIKLFAKYFLCMLLFFYYYTRNYLFIIKDQEMNLSVINLTKMRKSNDYLQEMLYRLEIEHCKKLLDIEMLEKHLNNYKCLVKQAEVCDI